MPVFRHLFVELPSSQLPDFHQFLLYHKKINSFQKVNHYFTINLLTQTQKEYSAFLQGIKEIFQIKKLKETNLCQARCKDKTSCLNKTKYGDFCWKHK